MKYSRRVEIFEQVKAENGKFLLSVLWKLAGDRELFTEAMQYALLGMWQHVEKLNGQKAQSYIYRIALSANSKAWRNRIGKDGDFGRVGLAPPQYRWAKAHPTGSEKSPDENLDRSELTMMVKQAISQLPAKQAKAIVMRYIEQHDYQTIAESLSCAEAGARSHVSKALATLKNKLTTFTQ